RDNTWALPGQGAFCTSCGKPIMLGAVICPRCGVPTDRRATAALATNLNSDTPNDIDDVARQEASQPFKRYSMIGATLVILVVVGILAMVWEMDFLRWCKNNEWKGPVFLTILGLSAIGTYADQTRKAPDGGFTVGTHIILGVGLVLAFLIGTVAGYVLNPIYKVSEGTFKGMGNVTISDAIDKLDDVSWGVSRSKDRPLVSVSASYSENGKANKIVASFVVSRGNDTFELTQASCNGQDLGADNFVAFLFKTANRK
ncbi:MAG: hypothetical protein WCH61_06950, partial [bacterium]